MTELQLQEELEAIHGKLDAVLAETSQQQRHRREMEDLRELNTPEAKRGMTYASGF
jgi:hypothetical protein